MNSHEVFIHIHQGCFAGTGAIVRLPQCQWNKPNGYGKISQCITTTKHSKAKTVCIFLGIYCTYIDYADCFFWIILVLPNRVLAIACQTISTTCTMWTLPMSRQPSQCLLIWKMLYFLWILPYAPLPRKCRPLLRSQLETSFVFYWNNHGMAFIDVNRLYEGIGCRVNRQNIGDIRIRLERCANELFYKNNDICFFKENKTF